MQLANFADDNTIYTANKSIEKLLEVLERESKSAIDCFKINDMIVNPDKFQAMIFSSDKKDKKFQLNINDSTISSEDSVTLLGIKIDNKLNFNNHVSTICKKANRQLNTIGRIQNYVGKKEKETIINTFVYTNFMYCPLAWHFCPKSSQNKIEKIQHRCLQLLTNDYDSDYKQFLEKTGKPTMEIRRLHTLALEIFKTLNDLNPTFMKNIFNFSQHCTHRKHDIFVHPRKTANYGDKSQSDHIFGTLCQMKSKLQLHCQYLRNLSKTGLVQNVSVNCAPFSLTVYGGVYYINFICKNQIINSVYIQEF